MYTLVVKGLLGHDETTPFILNSVRVFSSSFFPLRLEAVLYSVSRITRFRSSSSGSWTSKWRRSRLIDQWGASYYQLTPTCIYAWDRLLSIFTTSTLSVNHDDYWAFKQLTLSVVLVNNIRWRPCETDVECGVGKQRQVKTLWNWRCCCWAD